MYTYSYFVIITLFVLMFEETTKNVLSFMVYSAGGMVHEKGLVPQECK